MRITGFGDFLIHLSPMANERFMQAETMRMSFTGAEANTCAALSLWGENVSFVTRLPEHPLAQKGVMALKSFGINTQHIAWGGKRMGLYFLENGASVRPSQVIYDRMDSGFTESSIKDFDIEAILSQTDTLYLTGITPALSEGLMDTSLTLCQEAHKHGIDITYDINFRPTLLSAKEAGINLKKLAPYITTLIGNEEHIKMLLDITSEFGENDREKRLLDIINQAREILSIPQIAVTVRRTLSASDSIIYAAFFDGKHFAVSPEYRLHVVDRVGSGDAFSSGLLYAKAKDFSVSDTVCFAAAACAMKHTITNDINFATVDEITKLMNFGTSDVRR